MRSIRLVWGSDKANLGCKGVQGCNWCATRNRRRGISRLRSACLEDRNPSRSDLPTLLRIWGLDGESDTKSDAAINSTVCFYLWILLLSLHVYLATLWNECWGNSEIIYTVILDSATIVGNWVCWDRLKAWAIHRKECFHPVRVSYQPWHFKAPRHSAPLRLRLRYGSRWCVSWHPFGLLCMSGEWGLPFP